MRNDADGPRQLRRSVRALAVEMTLAIFFLTVESSYAENMESIASAHPDTIQWLFTPAENWRIKTFAIDEDVHVWSIGTNLPTDPVEFAVNNTEKHYGDVLGKRVIVGSSDGFDALKTKLEGHGLSPHLEIDKGGFAFWAPAGTHYRTRTTPK